MYYLQHKINYFRNIYKLEIKHQIFNVVFKLQPSSLSGREVRLSYMGAELLDDFRVTKCAVTVLQFLCTHGGFHKVNYRFVIDTVVVWMPPILIFVRPPNLTIIKVFFFKVLTDSVCVVTC